jgi:hypothetical protein
MNFLKRLLAWLSGKSKPEKRPSGQYQEVHVKITPRQINEIMARREREQNERIAAAEVRLKEWLGFMLREKGDLEFTWDSGNDEAFVTFKAKTEAEEDNFCDLEEYIIDKLDIPDAGEFQMNGRGTIYIGGDSVRARYSSTMKAIVDYDEATEKEIYSEEERDSGDKILFSV